MIQFEDLEDTGEEYIKFELGAEAPRPGLTSRPSEVFRCIRVFRAGRHPHETLGCMHRTPGTRPSTASSPPSGRSRSGTSPRSSRRDRPIRRAVDLGCGPGELTAALADQLAIADMTGVDSSPAMLADAAEPRPARAAVRGGRHRPLDVDGRPRPRLQQRRPAVGARPPGRGRPLVGGLAPGRPARRADPGQRRPPVAPHRRRGRGHRAVPRRRWAATPPPDTVAATVLDPVQYAILLDHLGAARQHVRLQVYGHTLARSADVVEWVKRHVADPLPAGPRSPDAVRAVRRRVPPPPAAGHRRHGAVLLPVPPHPVLGTQARLSGRTA